MSAIIFLLHGNVGDATKRLHLYASGSKLFKMKRQSSFIASIALILPAWHICWSGSMAYSHLSSHQNLSCYNCYELSPWNRSYCQKPVVEVCRETYPGIPCVCLQVFQWFDPQSGMAEWSSRPPSSISIDCRYEEQRPRTMSAASCHPAGSVRAMSSPVSTRD